MVRIWLISDTHFGHENMYHFESFDKTHRVRERFLHAKEADEFMCDAWNDLVKVTDHVYHLGDVAMNFAPWVARIKSLPGHKRLILGNHDKGKLSEYQAAGFQKIMAYRWWDRSAILSHVPMHESSLMSRLNIHGHIHERIINNPLYRNVCVEHTNYAPIQLDEVLATKESE